MNLRGLPEARCAGAGHVGSECRARRGRDDLVNMARISASPRSADQRSVPVSRAQPGRAGSHGLELPGPGVEQTLGGRLPIKGGPRERRAANDGDARTMEDT